MRLTAQMVVRVSKPRRFALAPSGYVGAANLGCRFFTLSIATADRRGDTDESGRKGDSSDITHDGSILFGLGRNGITRSGAISEKEDHWALPTRARNRL